MTADLPHLIAAPVVLPLLAAALMLGAERLLVSFRFALE